MQIKSNLTICLTRKSREGSAERTVAWESLMIPIMQLLQTWGLWHWNSGHFIGTEVMPFTAVEDPHLQVCCNCCGTSVCFRVWFRHLDAYPGHEQLDWKALKNWCLKAILDFHCQTQRTFCNLEASNDWGPNLQFFILLGVGKKFDLLLWCGNCLSELFPLPLYPWVLWVHRMLQGRNIKPLTELK